MLALSPPINQSPLQVAFQLYEDAPQELRSRLWMAVLEHPELCTEYQTLAAELQRERQQAAGAGGAAHAAAVQPGAAEPGAAAGEPGADAGASQQSEAASAALGEGHPADPSSRSIGDEAAAPAGEEEEAEHAPADLAHLASSSSGMHEPDPAHLASSYGAPWAAQHVPGGEGSMSPRGSGAERHPSQGRHSSLGRHGARGGGGGGDEDGWQLVTDQAAARRLQGAVLLAGSQEPAAYSREREGFRNSEWLPAQAAAGLPAAACGWVAAPPAASVDRCPAPSTCLPALPSMAPMQS